MRLPAMLALGVSLLGLPGPVGALDDAAHALVNTAAASPQAKSDTLPDSAHPADTLNPTLTQGGMPSQTSQDTLTPAPDSYKSRSDTVLVVKHSFNHRQQIIAGSVVMTCLMLMMVTMNNYNPR